MSYRFNCAVGTGVALNLFYHCAGDEDPLGGGSQQIDKPAFASTMIGDALTMRVTGSPSPTAQLLLQVGDVHLNHVHLSPRQFCQEVDPVQAGEFGGFFL